MKNVQIVVLAIVFAILLGAITNGCKKEDNPAAPPPVVEHPPATAVTMVITDLVTGVVDTCMVRDTTLVPGKPALVGSLTFTAGHTYSGTFRLYDESVTPTLDVTADIISERDAHLFQFAPSDTNRVKVSNLDKDSKGLAFGINYTITVTAGQAATGKIHVILQHHDDGIKFNADGSYHQDYDLDVDADFPYTIN